MAAVIQMNGGNPPLTTTASTLVNLSNADNDGVLGWEWTLKDKPATSTATITDPLSATASITPDVPGTYLIQLETYDDAGRTALDDTDQQGVAVRYTGQLTWRIPAAGETTEFDSEDGYAAELNLILDEIRTELIAAGGGGGGTCKGALDAQNATSTWANIGALYLTAGTLDTNSRFLMGALTGSDTAEVELRRETGGTLIATWSQSGTLQDTVLGSTPSIPANDWYNLRLRAQTDSDTALVKGFNLVVS